MSGDTSRVSIIICTYGRSEVLKNLLTDLVNQEYDTGLFEVIIVDQTPDDSVQNIIPFFENKLRLKYMSARKYPPSLTVSRNIGVEMVDKSSEIVVFLDDDVRLKSNFLRELLITFQKNDAMAVGNIYNKNIYFITKVVNILFHFYKYSGRVLKWWKAEQVSKKGIERVEWLGGYCMAYKKEVFEKLRFDEKLKRWSYFEDVDFSYRVNMLFGNVFSNSNLPCVHLTVGEGRIPKKYEITMRFAYRLYFFNKHFKKNTFASIIFLWSFIGDMIQIAFHNLGDAKGSKKFHILMVNMRNITNSIFYLLKNHTLIESGEDPYLFNK